MADANRSLACHHYSLVNTCGNVKVRGNKYTEGLVKLAFSYSDATYELAKGDAVCSQKREAQLLELGDSAFMWAATNPALEKQLIPVRIPIFKGLLGIRIAVIHKDEKERFEAIRDLDQLKSFTVGQGADWSDTKIMQYAGFQIVSAGDIYKLYKMLDAKRFDMLPRGVMEPWGELRELNNPNFFIEQSFVIAYPMPAYIFVSPKQPELATIIREGLNQAVADGAFNHYFLSDKLVSEAIAKANLESREIFVLNNPHLPKATPLDRKELWIDILSPMLASAYLLTH